MTNKWATLVNMQPEIYYQNFHSFYPSEPFTLDHSIMRHPVVPIRFCAKMFLFLENPDHSDWCGSNGRQSATDFSWEAWLGQPLPVPKLYRVTCLLKKGDVMPEKFLQARLKRLWVLYFWKSYLFGWGTNVSKWSSKLHQLLPDQGF